MIMRDGRLIRVRDNEENLYSKSIYRYIIFVYSQIILAFGNYMNSAKRGPVYGFKLQSLDMVSRYIYI